MRTAAKYLQPTSIVHNSSKLGAQAPLACEPRFSSLPKFCPLHVITKMPSTFLRYRRTAQASTDSQSKSGSVHLKPAEIALVSVFSALIVGVMIFCLYRFTPGLAGRQRRKANSQQPVTDVKQTFLDLDDEKTLTDNHAPPYEVTQTFLHLDDDKPPAEKKGLGIDLHPALRSTSGARSKRKHGSSNRDESLDSTTSITPLIKNPDQLPTSPSLTYSPRIYSPSTSPPVPGFSTEVRVSLKRTRPLPTPMQPINPSFDDPFRHDISPLQSSATLPHRSQLPMSFLIEIDAKREDQTGGRSCTVSPLQNPATPIPERLLSESHVSSRNVSPISAPSTTPVITHPSNTPVYLPRPFSKYNPYRPALEPATSKNWPLENMTIPEHSPMTPSPVRKQLTQSPLKPQDGTTSPSPPSTPTPARSVPAPEKEVAITHPELDTIFLADFHRRRRQQQKAREENQKQKRTLEKEKRKAQAAALRPAKKLTLASKEKGIPPNYRSQQDDSERRPPSGHDAADDGNQATSKAVAESKGRVQRLTMKNLLQQQEQQWQRQGLPPRLPSKSRKPSQSPDAYEKARRISGLHELVGSSWGNRPGI